MNLMHGDIESVIKFFSDLPEPDKAYGKRAAELLMPFLNNNIWSGVNTSNLCGAITKGILEWHCSDNVRAIAEKKCEVLCDKAIALTYAQKNT
jgi:hypothetical protein